MVLWLGIFLDCISLPSSKISHTSLPSYFFVKSAIVWLHSYKITSECSQLFTRSAKGAPNSKLTDGGDHAKVVYIATFVHHFHFVSRIERCTPDLLYRRGDQQKNTPIATCKMVAFGFFLSALLRLRWSQLKFCVHFPLQSHFSAALSAHSFHFFCSICFVHNINIQRSFVVISD